ncbi:MAG TPA: histidine kinase, partial [Roseiflexaceae bacterium]|nr:histidine kinase [Roseiflexaceae bacterium]
VLAQIVWVGVVVLALGLFSAAMPMTYRRLSTPPAAVQTWLAQFGLSLSFYTAYMTALQVVFGLACFVMAAVVVRRKSDDRMALYVSLLLVLLGAVNAPNIQAAEALSPALFFPAEFANFLLYTCLILFAFLFPDGRFVPRWSGLLVLVWLVGSPLSLFLTQNSLSAPHSDWFWPYLMILGGLVSGLVAQVYRYRRVSSQVQRQQTKWVVFGIAVAFAVQLSGPLLSTMLPSPPEIQETPYDLVGVTAITFAFFLIPLAIGISILRYRLWDIDLIIKRTLVYSALTACVAGIYVLVVGYLGAVFRSNGNLLISLVATGVVAVLFQPLRDRLQRGVNRLLYGLRDEPYVVLAGLGQRLKTTLDPDAVLSTIVTTVREALKLSYAAIALATTDDRPPTIDDRQAAMGDASIVHGPSSAEDGFRVVAASGAPPAQAALRLPLMHQGESVGTLLIAPRGRDDTLTPADLRLLDDLTQQVGIAVHTVRLTDDLRALTRDLQRSREQLVVAREEERRRLRRDLHDDLAPSLAGLAFTASTARDLVATDPSAATTLLDDLHAGIRAVVGEIRRLVYDLRPPALDEFGLVAALRERAAQYSDQARADAQTSLHVDVEAPERLPPLPAAVEVAAYRIVQEALMNVVRHAQAHTCHIHIALTDGLQVEILDDGVGVPEQYQPGVGLRSMRERAAELGGSCVIERREPAGTRVIAWLPLRKEERDGPTAPADR